MLSPDLKTPENPDSDKKLWLDYLSKLRDREDRSSQITGATNWVLCGLMGTLFYKGIEFVPLAFSNKEYRYNTYIFLVFGFNFLTFGTQLISDFLPKVKVESEIRAIPYRLADFIVHYFILFAICAMVLGSIELYFGYQNPALARPVRLSLFAFGVFHIFLGFFCGASFYVKRWFDRLQPDIFPFFSSESLRGESWTNTLYLLAVCMSLLSITTHLHRIISISPTWLASLQSAFGALIFLWAAYKLIVLRPNRAQIVSAITDLEQQALVENLSSSQIRERFNKLTSGIGLGEWLRESSELATSLWGDFQRYLGEASMEVSAVCSSLPSNDKLASLCTLKKKIQFDTAELSKPISATAFRIGAAATISWAFNRATVKEMLQKFNENNENADRLRLQRNDLFKLLDTEINRAQDQLSAPRKNAADKTTTPSLS
jgi:hypothetical protein